MSLRSIKKRLSIDQRNILRGVVTATGDDTVTVRLSDGAVRRCRLPAGVTFARGAAVQVETDGMTYTATGPSPLAELGGELVVTI